MSASHASPAPRMTDARPSNAQKVSKSAAPASEEAISPLLLAKTHDVDDFSLDQRGPSHRFTAAPIRKSSLRRPRAYSSASPRSAPAIQPARRGSIHVHHDRLTDKHHLGAVIDSIIEWFYSEKSKRRVRKTARHRRTHAQTDGTSAISTAADSDDSDGSLALDKLEEILQNNQLLDHLRRRSSTRLRSQSLRHSTSARMLRRSSVGASSDTEYVDADAVVPSCETVLDNSKTLSYCSMVAAVSQSSLTDGSEGAKEPSNPWSVFKYEIVRLTHTLRIKGWRQVPMDRSEDVDVERLSGALTNAVYVVTPPRDIAIKRLDETQIGDHQSQVKPHSSKRRPKKLLLRIYGPQVEHLIDREAELSTLRRLARQRIGPRLLGTFINGRFEEYLNAQTLTPQDLRDPQTSRQIAKRMRELHDGIELLDSERANGPFLWRNWDKWVERCEKIVTFTDKHAMKAANTLNPHKRAKKRDFVCGTDWVLFRKTVERYRKWLDERCGGPQEIKDQLVFAHNDTQYGNILRLEPPGESPLLLPANKHKQLVVIDFEYSNANARGLEFANHFTEWCYDYHDPSHPDACDVTRYPTPEEQTRFIHAYVTHQPAFTPAASTPRLVASTPSLKPSESYTSATEASRRPNLAKAHISISTPVLGHARFSSSPGPIEEPAGLAQTETTASTESSALEGSASTEVARLKREALLWRPANSAQWVAWGIMQARVPGLHAGDATCVGGAAVEDDGDDEDEEFDYLSYARERVMFFWGDMVQLGIMEEHGLPKDVREGLKLVRY